MGIKFRGKTSTGDPITGSIKERELEINLVDKTLFTSSNGTNVIKLTSSAVIKATQGDIDAFIEDTKFVTAKTLHDSIQWDDKVDTVVGKGLSTNDYTTADRNLITSALQVHQDISGKVDVVTGKVLSSNDFTNAEQTKLAGLEGSHFKGTHHSEAELIAAHPTAEAGSYAYVMVHGKEHNFIWDGSIWVDTGAATAVHLTNAQIKTQYENNSNTNAFTDTNKSTLASALQSHQDISGKVDSVAGKGLSTNDYTSTDKSRVASALQSHQSIAGKVDKITGMGLSHNDYSSTEKAKVASALQTHQALKGVAFSATTTYAIDDLVTYKFSDGITRTFAAVTAGRAAWNGSRWKVMGVYPYEGTIGYTVGDAMIKDEKLYQCIGDTWGWHVAKWKLIGAATVVNNLTSSSITEALSAQMGSALLSAIDVHKSNQGNPHHVTASQVGAAAVSHSHGSLDRSSTDLNGATVFDRIEVVNGIVTDVATRTLTATNIGAAAVAHVHTNFDRQVKASTGATVFSQINVDQGIVKGVVTRELTAGSIGAATSAHQHTSYDNSTTLSGSNVYSKIAVTNGIVTGLSTRSIITNGTGYVKYSDGTMICYGKTSGLTYDSASSNYFGSTAGTTTYRKSTINYAQSFSSSPTVICSGMVFGSASAFSTGVGTSGFVANTLSRDGTAAGNTGVYWIAIGRH